MIPREDMKSALLLLLFSVLYSIHAIGTEEGKESISSFSAMTLSDALNTLKKTLNDEKTVRKFFHEHIVNNNDFNYCGKPSSCAELFHVGFRDSGIYKIHLKPWLKSNSMLVYCDMETDGGGWTVFQRRGDFEVNINFTRDWSSYSIGFGDLDKEFWLGNENIHTLTMQDNVVLRIDLEDFDDVRRFALYNEFEVGSKDELYKMKVDQFSGNAGDSFGHTNGATFVTYDKGDVHNCAKNYRGGWWYKSCHHSNLNGRYLRGNHTSYADGVNWLYWLGYHYSLKWTEMKIRPKQF